MEPAQGSPPPPPPAALLCDTFSLVPCPGSPLSLSLTPSELLTRSLPPHPGGPPHPPLRLADCLGCRSFQGSDPADVGGYFTVVFYPPRRGWLGSVASRQRLCKTFRTEATRDRERNLTLATTWAQKIWQLAARREEQGLPCSPLPSPMRLLVLLNPRGGTGDGLTLFQAHVTPMLTEVDARVTLLVTERRNQARELVRDEDLSRWDVIVVMSGDGLMSEVVNGLMERPDWPHAIKKPLSILPGGSGNALAASISHYSGHEQVVGAKLLTNCTFVLCKGQALPLDLVSLTTTTSEKRIFSFLSLAWGFVSDVDIESEKYRFMGSARFTVGTAVRLTALRTYGGRLSYLPAGPSLEGLEVTGEQDPGGSDSLRNQPNSNNSAHSSPLNCGGYPVLRDPLLVPLDQPLPSHWSVVQEDQFVLVLALYQSHLGADLYTAPMVKRPGEGLIHLFYATSRISRASLLKLFLAMEKGTHLDTGIPHVTHIPVKAFRIEPFQSSGVMTVDGEILQCGPVQGQIHRGLGRIVSIPQGT